MGYLPFKCKYCGKIFCKKHRLPENHDCTFELKHTPIIPITPGEVKSRPSVIKLKKSSPYEGVFRKNKEAKKYEKQKKRQNKQLMRFTQGYLYGANELKGTKFLLIMIILFSLVAVIPLLIIFSSTIPIAFYIWLIFTSPFNYLGGYNPIALLFMIILLIFFFFMARNIETLFGSKFLIQLYIFCTLMKALFFIILRVPFVLLSQSHIIYIFPIELFIGAFLGFLTFSLYPDLEKKRLFFYTFIPIRLKGRTILIGLILINLFVGIFYLLFGGYYSFADYVSNLGGILGSYIIFLKKVKHQKSTIHLKRF